MEIISYTPELEIKNTKYLAPGLGLRYLECIRSHTGDLVAKMWHREMPTTGEVVVTF
jgi:hypothetical protein